MGHGNFRQKGTSEKKSQRFGAGLLRTFIHRPILKIKKIINNIKYNVRISFNGIPFVMS